MQDKVSQEVTHFYEAIVEELGESFSWNLLLAQVAYMRNRPILIEELSLPIGVTLPFVIPMWSLCGKGLIRSDR